MKRKFVSMILAIVMIASMFSFGGMALTASATTATATAISEVWIEGGYEAMPEMLGVGIEGDYLQYSINKKSEADAIGEKAKWFPVFDRMIDLSKIIPKKAGKPVYIGLRGVDEDGNITDSAIAVKIDGRQDGSALKTDAKEFYKDGAFGKITHTNVEWKLTNDAYYSPVVEGTGNNATLTSIPADVFPFGATGVVRLAMVEKDDAATDKANVEGYKFASPDVKFKIPAQPKAPKTDKIAIDEKKGTIKGINEKMEILVNGAWVALKKDMTASEFVKTITGTTLATEFADEAAIDTALAALTLPADGKYTIRFAADKKPSSAKAEMTLTTANLKTGLKKLIKEATPAN